MAAKKCRDVDLGHARIHVTPVRKYVLTEYWVMPETGKCGFCRGGKSVVTIRLSIALFR